MRVEFKQIEKLCCPKCGGNLTLEKDSVVGICLHCNSAFLLTDEEAAIIKRQQIESTTVKHDCAGIISRLCASNKSWRMAADEMYVSESMKNSFLHKKKMEKAKRNWGIPEEEDVFIIVDTGIKSFSLGVAFCTSGIYYVENSLGQKGKLTYEEFKNANIVAAGKDILLINELHFQIIFSARDVARVFKTIQSSI